MEKELSPQESLQLIQSMIDKAKIMQLPMLSTFYFGVGWYFLLYNIVSVNYCFSLPTCLLCMAPDFYRCVCFFI